MNSKILTLFGMVAGLLLTALLTHNGDVAWMALPFLAYLGVGILRAPALEQVRLQAARVVEKVSQGEDLQIQVSVTVCNQGPDIEHLTLFDLSQPGMRWVEGHPQLRGALRSGEEMALSYTFKAERGLFTWKTIQAVASDPLGLIGAPLVVPAEAEIQVQPELQYFRSLSVRPQRTVHSAGSVPARLGGSGTDFWGIREYHPGDSLRRLDWQHAARHPGAIYTREFEQEEIADIGLILDARQNTDLRVGQESLFEHATRATASLAEVFLGQGNRVSLLVYGDPMHSVYPGYGKVQLQRMLNTLSQVSTESGGSLGGLQFLPVRMFSSRSIILIISPLVSGDWQLFPRLRAYGYQVVLISPDPVDYAERMLPNDPLSSMSIRLTRLERQLEIKKIARLWVPVIDWQVSQPLAPLVRSALTYSHLQRGR